MTEKPARQEIDELVRRLRSSPFHLSDIREAGEILATTLDIPEAYGLGLDFATSDNEQVRTLGLCIMEALAPKHDAARGFLSGARDAARLLGSGSQAEEKKGPDYSAIGEVIKVWLRESRNRRKPR
jgi:hypothetical protein